LTNPDPGWIIEEKLSVVKKRGGKKMKKRTWSIFGALLVLILCGVLLVCLLVRPGGTAPTESGTTVNTTTSGNGVTTTICTQGSTTASASTQVTQTATHPVTTVPPADRNRIEEAWDINNSDMELCEFLGRTLIYYSWGDQHGTEFLAEAWYEGPMHEFLKSWFEPKE
jgi:hypothetical protein